MSPDFSPGLLNSPNAKCFSANRWRAMNFQKGLGRLRKYFTDLQKPKTSPIALGELRQEGRLKLHSKCWLSHFLAA
jgi:hypothetical protein